MIIMRKIYRKGVEKLTIEFIIIFLIIALAAGAIIYFVMGGQDTIKTTAARCAWKCSDRIIEKTGGVFEDLKTCAEVNTRQKQMQKEGKITSATEYTSVIGECSKGYECCSGLEI